MLHESKRVRTWVWIVPALMLLSALVVTDYQNLGDVGLGFTLSLALGSLLVGTGEELMFRGVGVEVLRRRGLTEAKVALWSSVVFGCAYLTNIITEGVGAFGQVFITALIGYFLYLCRRVSGGIVVPILLHAAWDSASSPGTSASTPASIRSRA